MRSLLNFLLRFKTLILFLVLEAVAIIMISTSHNYHQTVLYGISRNITGFVAERLERGTYYFRLRRSTRSSWRKTSCCGNSLQDSLPADRRDSFLYVTASAESTTHT
jgi:hypothetical protein